MQTKPRDVRDSIEQLGPWFHNLHLPGGVQTAPQHFLGDFPARKWVQLEPHLPKDLSGWRCLDIGSNAGFYSFELAKRGADVLGIDSEPLYLSQAEWVAKTFYPECRVRFSRMQIHDLARMAGDFDLVLFMGVFYHLRYPQLALDTVARKVRRMMVFQTLSSDPEKGLPPIFTPESDYPITERKIFDQAGWPRMSFIEKKYSNDATNWWVPNHAGIEAMLRSTGFERFERIGHEMYICIPPAQGVLSKRHWPEDEWRAAVGGGR